MNHLNITHVKRNSEPFNMKKRHYHNQYEIYYLLNGERNYFINQRSYHVTKGDLVLINKNVLHKTSTIDKNNPNHERILIQFNQNLFANLKNKMLEFKLFNIFNRKRNIITLNPKQQLWIEDQLFKLITENKTHGNKFYLKIIIVELLIFIKRISFKLDYQKFNYPDEKHKNISRVATYISTNYQKNLSLSFLADKYNYSQAYLSRIFKEVTGFNFVEYKNNVRIKEASKLLQQSNLSVTEIASQVGFNNITHFGRVFKEFTGLSPLEYRKVKDL